MVACSKALRRVRRRDSALSTLLCRRHLPSQCLLMTVAFMTLLIPAVHARESVAIKELQYPSEVDVYNSGAILIKNSQASTPTSVASVPVAGTVSYANIVDAEGSHLDVSVWESTAYGTSPAKGSCKTSGQSRYSCKNTQIQRDGSMHFQFELAIPTEAGLWNLTVRAAIHAYKDRVLCEDHQDFTILTRREVKLTVNAPSDIPVLVDGVSYSGYEVLLALTGPHELSVPNLFQFKDCCTRLRFLQWTDGSTASSRTVILVSDAEFEATYAIQYLLTLQNPLWENGTRTGWYDKDSKVQLQALPDQPISGILGMLGCKWRFRGWYENGIAQGWYEYGKLLVRVDRPRTLMANYQGNYTPLIAVLVLVAATASIVAVVGAYDWRGKLERARSALQSRLSSVRRGRGTTGLVVAVVLTIISVCVSLSRTVITVILGRKGPHIVTWRETQSPHPMGSVAQILVAQIDVSGILDPVTGTGFDDGESAWRCTNCQMFYHDQTYHFLSEQNSGRCVGCLQSRLKRSKVGKIEAVPIKTVRPAIRFEVDTRRGIDRRPRQQPVFEPPVARLDEVSQYIGHVIYFQGKVVEVQKSRSTETYCVKFQRGPWSRVFKLVIFPNYVRNFRFGGQTINDYEHKTIRVRGLIQDHSEWGLEIIVNSENAIEVID